MKLQNRSFKAQIIGIVTEKYLILFALPYNFCFVHDFWHRDQIHSLLTDLIFKFLKLEIQNYRVSHFQLNSGQFALFDSDQCTRITETELCNAIIWIYISEIHADDIIQNKNETESNSMVVLRLHFLM